MREGDTIDQYILQEKLIEDDYGEIWKAQTDTHITKTLKIPKNSMEELIQQAQINKKLDHENILKIEEIKNNYLVLENFEAENLKQKQNLTYEQKLQIIIQTAKALSYAHNKGIIHSDLRPEHILVNENLKVKIINFSYKPQQNQINALKTQDKNYINKIAYMSPEQLKGEQPTKQSDIFSLTKILYELLTEKPRTQDQPQSLDSKIKKILRKGLEKKPKKRYKNMPELTKNLTHYLNKLDIIRKYTFKNIVKKAREYTVTISKKILIGAYYTLLFSKEFAKEFVKASIENYMILRDKISELDEETKEYGKRLIKTLTLLFLFSLLYTCNVKHHKKTKTDKETVIKMEKQKTTKITITEYKTQKH